VPYYTLLRCGFPTDTGLLDESPYRFFPFLPATTYLPFYRHFASYVRQDVPPVLADYLWACRLEDVFKTAVFLNTSSVFHIENGVIFVCVL
jgi:hypothetical protein